MKVGILGTGDVGRTLGGGFIGLGYEVKMGSRKPGRKEVKDWVAKNAPRASAGTYAETAAFAELAVLAVPWSGAEKAIKLTGPKNLAGKVVIDATNPLVFPSNAPPGLALGHTDSAGEQIQRWLPEAHVVKAFNIGGIEGARFIEPLAMLWIIYGNHSGSWNHAFKLLCKQPDPLI